MCISHLVKDSIFKILFCYMTFKKINCFNGLKKRTLFLRLSFLRFKGNCVFLVSKFQMINIF